MRTTLKISDEAARLVQQIRAQALLFDADTGEYEYFHEINASHLVQEAINAATATQQAECERLTNERDSATTSADKHYAEKTELYGAITKLRAACEALRKELAEAESSRDEQGRNAVGLFDECKRLQRENAEMAKDKSAFLATVTHYAHHEALTTQQQERAYIQYQAMLRSAAQSSPSPERSGDGDDFRDYDNDEGAK